MRGSPPIVYMQLRRPSRATRSTGASGAAFAINPSDRLRIRGSAVAANRDSGCTELSAESSGAATCTAAYSWGIVEGVLDVSEERAVLSDAGSEYFVLAPNSIVGGTRYTVQLNVTFGGATGTAQLSLRGNVPPRGGALRVSPPVGELFSTPFHMSLLG